ncbi:ABC transporter substrate-binding protein [Paenibacillus whitsoniae]|uniref:ABC transporter substrate-binding protein n=1 Tax=Paenibacillus whitsoniae TaxID=2496558 RepID=A0A3S0BU72_9BACL|nr:Fe(3+) dicitrate ABC transporter substrate-binding protein [Paenibacillus whitsoniae]RTE08426.1 ABC transporter substrate-binding protein [Paenibacillus whitsoniae]
MRTHFSRIILLLIISLFALSLAACGKGTNTESTAGTPAPATGASASAAPTAKADGPITIQDASGTLVLPKKPERVVAMEFSFTDILVSLGVKPVGVADDGDASLMMDSVKALLPTYTSVGSRYEPNIELISSLKPDLIIVDINKHKNAIAQLKGIAPVLVLDDFMANYDQMLKNVTLIGKAVGKEDEAKKRLAEHQTKVDTIKKKLNASGMKVLPAVVNPKGFFAHSDHAYSGSFLAMLGYTDPVKNDASYPQITLEQLVEANPQALFLLPTDKVTIVQEWEKNPLWAKIDAVKNNKVYTVERRDWSLSRGLLGSEKMLDDLVKNMGQ